MSIHVFGIRHHGPGCARSLVRALDELQPDVVVVEGPADGEEILTLAARENMRPPVAMLLYDADEPRRSVYYPLADFSPEWQAFCWALRKQINVRLMDLPQTIQLAMQKAAEKSDDGSAEPAPDEALSGESPWRTDPIGLLAEAAGYHDRELWWEHEIERRSDVSGLFAAILEAMRTVREEFPETRRRDLLREAHMRRTIREVSRGGFEKIAVICGAWHAPVLDEDAVKGKRDGCRIKDDTERLKGLPKLKTVATWVPWTYSRMTYRSGYGAGVDSPGWYSLVWASNDGAPVRWIATAARLLRASDLEASSASVIEALRLAETLASIRELRSPGLQELNEAILTVLCHGQESPLQLIRRELEIGTTLGEVPDEAPAVPLARNLAELQKSLRLKPTTAVTPLTLDLRKEFDRERSIVLHRLRLLNITWGVFQESGSRTSTFRETWQLEWKPELAIDVVEASVWGNTLELASMAYACQKAGDLTHLPEVTELLDAAILASLDNAVPVLLSRIQEMAAVGSDVRHLMESIGPLGRISRYGDVRGTNAQAIEPILSGLFQRIFVGLVPACAGLDEDASWCMIKAMQQVMETLDLLRRDDLLIEWFALLQRINSQKVHPLIRGWCCRILLERRLLTDELLSQMAHLNLSPALPPGDCAAWVNGLLHGSGLLLLHQEVIWDVFNRWLCELDANVYTEMVPLLRRAFSGFSGPERRQMGEKVRTLGLPESLGQRSAETKIDPGRTHRESGSVHRVRAETVMPALAQILGVPYQPGGNANGSH